MTTSGKFHDVMRPPLWLIAFIAFMFGSLVLAIWAALGDRAASIAGAALALLTLFIYFAASTTISFDGVELRVGRAHIEKIYLGAATIVPKRDFLVARTRGADPAAYFALVFWVSEGVKIEIKDARDLTPYWLISTKRGKELIAALES
jgi:Protein of unknown function (DUF3093)